MITFQKRKKMLNVYVQWYLCEVVDMSNYFYLYFIPITSSSCQPPAKQQFLFTSFTGTIPVQINKPTLEDIGIISHSHP